jgi:hypothetical protein
MSKHNCDDYRDEFCSRCVEELEAENKQLREALLEIKQCTNPDNGELMPWSYMQVNVAASKALEDECNHEWVCADNPVVTGAEVCTKCSTIRAKALEGK